MLVSFNFVLKIQVIYTAGGWNFLLRSKFLGQLRIFLSFFLATKLQLVTFEYLRSELAVSNDKLRIFSDKMAVASLYSQRLNQIIYSS